MTMISEMWRLPDKTYLQMDDTSKTVCQLAIREDNWHGYYRVLPDYGETIKQVPEGSIPLIIDGKWLT